MKFILLAGPPAVGKMTVGQHLSKKTGIPLLHNHMIIDPVESVFPRGTEAFETLVGEFRLRMVEEAAKAGGKGIIHTLVWAFGNPGDEEFVKKMKDSVESNGGECCFVELKAKLETRVQRHRSPNRMLHKAAAAATPPAYMEEIEKQFKTNTDGDFPYPDQYLLLDTEALSAEECATKIVEHFAL